MASESKVTLKSSDNELFEVSESVASESLVVKNMIEMLTEVNVIPLPNVSGKILSKVVEYCKYHVESQNLTDDEMKTWDKEFVKVDQATLFDLIRAANYLDMKNLLDLTCQTVSNMLKGMTPEQIRKTFNIKNDFIREEEDTRHHN